jgi:hypothetical protein
MKREQFDDWGKSLSESDFWRAVGIANWHQGRHRWSCAVMQDAPLMT